LRSGERSRYGALDNTYMNATLLRDNGLPIQFDQIPVPVPTVARNSAPAYQPFASRSALLRMAEALGSKTNPYPLTLLAQGPNGVKGRLAANNNPRDLDKIKKDLKRAKGGDEQALEDIFSILRTVSTFNQVSSSRNRN